MNVLELIKEIPIDSIPTVIGGKFKSSNELIQFNTRTDGPFHSLDIDEKIEFATAKEMNYSLSQVYKNDENDHNITENKINLENSDLTDEDSEENMTDQIDFDKDSSYLTCKTEIKTVPVIKSITNSNENKNSKMTKEEKETEIMRGYNSDITKYNEIIVQRNVISSFNSPKKDSINFREKLLKNGLEFSHILKIKIGRTNENFLESRVRMMEEKKIKKCEEEERGKREAERERERVRDTENHNELADLETVKRTRKGNSRCSDVSVMSSERSCKVNCSVQ